jgi:hypothetical protein
MSRQYPDRDHHPALSGGIARRFPMRSLTGRFVRSKSSFDSRCRHVIGDILFLFIIGHDVSPLAVVSTLKSVEKAVAASARWTAATTPSTIRIEKSSQDRVYTIAPHSTPKVHQSIS